MLTDRTIAALRMNHDDLAQRVQTYDEDDLARTSGAAEWDVAQVLGHLGSGAEIMLATLRAGVAGDELPGQEFTQSVWDRWNAMTRRQKGEGFLRANEQLVSAYERLDTDARRDVRVPLPFLPSPADVGSQGCG